MIKIRILPVITLCPRQSKSEPCPGMYRGRLELGFKKSEPEPDFLNLISVLMNQNRNFRFPILFLINRSRNFENSFQFLFNRNRNPRTQPVLVIPFPWEWACALYDNIHASKINKYNIYTHIP